MALIDHSPAKRDPVVAATDVPPSSRSTRSSSLPWSASHRISALNCHARSAHSACGPPTRLVYLNNHGLCDPKQITHFVLTTARDLALDRDLALFNLHLGVSKGRGYQMGKLVGGLMATVLYPADWHSPPWVAAAETNADKAALQQDYRFLQSRGQGICAVSRDVMVGSG